VNTPAAGRQGKIAVVIAAYNEADAIGAVLAELPSSLVGADLEVIVVDDGSSDQTAEAARGHVARVLRHDANQGQGAALRTGFECALAGGATVVVTMDADGQHDPADLRRLVEPVLDGHLDYVQGSRYLGRYDEAGSARSYGIRVFTLLINLVGRLRITDCTNGYRAINARALARLELRENRFSAAELLIEAGRHHLRVLEVPVHIRRRAAGVSKKPRSLRYPLGFLGVVVRVGSRRWRRSVAGPWDAEQRPTSRRAPTDANAEEQT